jgi:RNA polymerase sigma-70 factor (subfamily 1)
VVSPDREPVVTPESVLLLKKYQTGDEDALNELLARYYPRVLRIVSARLGPALRGKVEVEDVAQETLMSAAKSLGDLEIAEDASLICWMASVAENQVLRAAEHFGAQKRDMHREEDLARPKPGSEESTFDVALVSESTSPGSRVERSEMSRIVDECLAQLPEDQREVILLREYAGGSWSFVAERLQRPSADAAMQLYRRARISLAEKVQLRT